MSDYFTKFDKPYGVWYIFSVIAYLLPSVYSVQFRLRCHYFVYHWSWRILRLIVAVHQPQYLPWLGYFDKMRTADVFCYLDNVQYKKNEWQNRNRIKTAHSRQWITVPVRYRFPQKINEVEINNTQKWHKKHLQALITNYSKAPYFNDYITQFEDCNFRSLRNRWLKQGNNILFLIEL